MCNSTKENGEKCQYEPDFEFCHIEKHYKTVRGIIPFGKHVGHEVLEVAYYDRPYLKWMSTSAFVKYKYPKLLVEVDKVLTLSYWRVQQTYLFSRNQIVNCYCGGDYLRKHENEHRQTESHKGYKDNRDQKVTCECGVIYTGFRRKMHIKTAQHQAWVANPDGFDKPITCLCGEVYTQRTKTHEQKSTKLL